ncbi:MAG: YeeE/YedE family protein [Sneathiellaceae bacterium]
MVSDAHRGTALPPVGPRQWWAAAALLVPGAWILLLHERNFLVFVIAVGLGLALYHGAVGFAGAYRQLFRDRDMTGVAMQMAMIVFASLLFAPVLWAGDAFGQPVAGALAPVGIGVAFGAVIFGIGMQLGGGCGSGTLYATGGGDARLLLTLLFFCAGGFWGSLDLDWWERLPMHPPVSLGRDWGFAPALAAQAALLLLLYLVLRWAGFRVRPGLWRPAGGWRWLLAGPWPLMVAGAALALLNFATLVTAGHPWTITWGLTLWGAKTARALGWDPAGSPFWRDGFPASALAEPVLADVTSVMDIGIVVGALAAAVLAGRFRLRLHGGPGPLLAAVLGGLMLGYGARLAYGCNIGALFSGAASTSLHAWLWLAAALPGNWLGCRLRPCFGLDGPPGVRRRVTGS